jgi:hypothetical protein
MPISKATIEAARQDARQRKEDEAQAKLKEEERAENEAARAAVGKAVDYLKEKASGVVKDISESDLAKGVRNYGRSYKEGLGMKPETPYEKRKGGVIKMAKGGSVKSASSRADGIAQRGKTRGKIC